MIKRDQTSLHWMVWADRIALPMTISDGNIIDKYQYVLIFLDIDSIDTNTKISRSNVQKVKFLKQVPSSHIYRWENLTNLTSPAMSFINFKVSNKKKIWNFPAGKSTFPNFYTTTTNTTVLFQFLPLSSECREWYLFSFFPIFSKFCLKKNFILWHIGLLDMFLHRSMKNEFKNTQNSPLYSILKLTFPKIFKHESFHFSQYSKIFFPTYA